MNTRKKSYIYCPLCKQNKYTIFLQPNKNISNPSILYGAASGIKGTQRLVKCLNCSLIYENPRLSSEDILDGYRTSLEEEHDSQFENRVNSFYKALKKNKKFLPHPGATVLDVGTASGAFLKAAKKYNYEAIGIDPSMDLVQRGFERGYNIKLGTIFSNDLEKKFDLICYWDVIEHLTNPLEVVIETRKYLKENGLILINFPDIGTLIAKLTGKSFWWILSVHLTQFSQNTMKSLLKKAGYEILSISPYWQTLEFGYLVLVAVKLEIPFSKLINNFLPSFLKKIKIPYYASQTTIIAKK